jgi:hypothetical protein
LFDAIYAKYEPYLLPIRESESRTFCPDSAKDVLKLNFAQINKRLLVKLDVRELGVPGTPAASMLKADIQRIFFPTDQNQIDKVMHLKSHVDLPDFKGKYMPKNEDDVINPISSSFINFFYPAGNNDR